MAIGVGIIGFGVSGRFFHAPLIASLSDLRLAAIATSRPEAAEGWGAAVASSPAELISDPAVDLVVIAAPNAHHAPLARAALLAGKHVVVDKPFVIDPAEGEALIELAATQGRVLSVFHNRRWDSDLLTVRRLLDEGTLGAIHLAELCWDRFRPAIKPGWREQPGPGAGLLADLGPHLIDQALHLFGPPDVVAADVATQREGALVDDYFAVTLSYGAARVRLASGSVVAAPRPRFAVHGSQGSFVKHGLDPQEAVLRAGARPHDAGYGVEPPELWGWRTGADGAREQIPGERGDWPAFYRAMAVAIQDGAPPPVDPRDALAGLKIIAAAHAGADERPYVPALM